MRDHVTARMEYEHQSCARCTAVPIPEVRSIADIDLASMMIKASTDPDCPDCEGRRSHFTPRAKAAQAALERMWADHCTRTFGAIREGDWIKYKANARKSDTRMTWQRVTWIQHDDDRVLFRTDTRRSKNPLAEDRTATVLRDPQDGSGKEFMREIARLHPGAVTFWECGCC
ncbi:hypothetical protein SUDANB1_05651 [Streptomyces sp. enrichment culture]|uniref:hypothetical protein n=1 Tax=Streptomyces sp. enrichment culture TaxID=1795815 RepID=UPI003F545774